GCNEWNLDHEPSEVTVYFFFQAEDGIRDYKVTGVQTCALPILNLPIGRFLGKGAHGQCDKVRAKAEQKFGGKAAVEKMFPDSAYQLTHNALFPKDCIHIENLGGEIEAPELQNKRLIVGCFPWKFK